MDGLIPQVWVTDWAASSRAVEGQAGRLLIDMAEIRNSCNAKGVIVS